MAEAARLDNSTHPESDMLTYSDTYSGGGSYAGGGSYSGGSGGRFNDFSGGDSYDSYGAGAGGDRMSNLGAGLRKPHFDLATLPRFEKNFYRESASVRNRSEREIEEFRNLKEIRVSGKHIPHPIETFEEAGFPCTSLILFQTLLTY